MIDYVYNEELNILEVTYSGGISPGDLIRYGEQIALNRALPVDVLWILSDLTNATYQVYPRDYDRLKMALAKHIERFNMVRTAFLQYEPRETALSMMFSDKASFPNLEKPEPNKRYKKTNEN